MIQYIREFALKNTVSVRLGLGSFLNYLRIGVGVRVRVSLQICAVLSPSGE